MGGHPSELKCCAIVCFDMYFHETYSWVFKKSKTVLGQSSHTNGVMGLAVINPQSAYYMLIKLVHVL